MTIRTALRHSKVLTFAVLFALLWLLLMIYGIATSFEWSAITDPSFIGFNPVGGIVGVVVMAVLAMVLIALYGELGAEDPAPEPWPPTE